MEKPLDNKLNKMMNDRRLKVYLYGNNKKKTLVHSQKEN